LPGIVTLHVIIRNGTMMIILNNLRFYLHA